MDKQEIVSKLKAHVEYLRRIRLPIGEDEACFQIRACAKSLEEFAKELTEDAADNKQG